MTGRANVVDRGVETLNASLAHVADLEPSLSALMGSSNRAAATAEVTFSALGSGGREAGRAAVVARCALRAFGDVGETNTVTVRAVGTQELSWETSTSGTIAASWTVRWCSSVVQAEGTRGASFADRLAMLILVVTSLADRGLRAADRASIRYRTEQV